MKGSQGDGPPMAWLMHLAVLCQAAVRVQLAQSIAIVNVTNFSASANRTLTTSVPGRYGNNSPVKGASGVVGIPTTQDALACEENVDFSATESTWIALVERGNCTFAKKIENGIRRGAAAVVIFNSAGKGNRTDPFIHYGKSQKSNPGMAIFVAHSCWSSCSVISEGAEESAKPSKD
ncbi:hypothetical protein chiPu_0004204 [Chiloscyllium punctatum]|uniref:PA domain-containing protein n=1 Tax=Chiloscyllium punctatum TaxID=137246 RepID=A0A401S5Y4_CHIPU|nr:hypothetical protein [Chiloscyllium punctatum]